MRFEMRSISETESGSASAPIVTSRPSGRNPCMLSTIDFVEFEVLRITSAPPAAARLFPSRTTSSAPRSRIILSLIGGMGNCDGLEACGLRVLHCQVPKPADPEHSHALMRLGIRPAKAAIDRVPRAEDRGCLLIGN